MPTYSEPLLDDALREILESLAGGLFPLTRWVEQKAYKPSQGPVPWRGPDGVISLMPKDLAIMPFFEALLRESARDAELLARWNTLRERPFTSTPLPDVEGWRARRGLAPTTEARFGAAESRNVLSSADGKQISRADFYLPYFPLLREVVKAQPSPVDWEALALSLYSDQCPQWPASPLRSSLFIKQFAADMLYAMLGMRNPRPHMQDANAQSVPQAEDELWRLALLIELGEHRRVGNRYTPAGVERSTRALERFIDQLIRSRRPVAAEAGLMPLGPPVGIA